MYCPSLLGLCRLHKPNSLYSILSVAYSVQKNLVPHSVNILFSLFIFTKDYAANMSVCRRQMCVIQRNER